MMGLSSREAGKRFDRLFKLGGSVDPHSLYRELREHRPVFWSEATQAFVLTRHADVRRLFATESEFAVLSGEAGATIHGRALLQMRGVEHRRKNAIIAREVRNVSALRGRIGELVEQVSHNLVGKLPEHPDIAELRSTLTGPLPLRVIAGLLGIDEPERLGRWYRDLALAGVENLIGSDSRQEAGLTALHRFESLIEPIIKQTRNRPSENLLSALATAEYGGAPLPDEELTTLAGFLLTAGVETIDRTMASLLYRLGSSGDAWVRLYEQPELIVPALAETLRVDSAVQGVGRLAIGDAEFCGVHVPQGHRLIGLIGSANRDEEVFDAAEHFDITRFADSADRQFTPSAEIMTFGAGPHHCTGSLLAKLEMSFALRSLLARFSTVEIQTDSPPTTGVMLRSPEEVFVRLKRRSAGRRPSGSPAPRERMHTP